MSRNKILFMFITLMICVVSALNYTATSNEIDSSLESIQNSTGGSLYPKATETRDLRTLDGLWNFRKSTDLQTEVTDGWFKQDLDLTGPVITMPVPSSYNDVGEDITLRDHVGVVWYDRRFYVPSSWDASGQRVWLRFSSVHYRCAVLVNGQFVMNHEIGHLPFEEEITDMVSFDSSNLLTVLIDNTLHNYTVPQGVVKSFFIGPNHVRKEQQYTFDFYNYAGIHRTVFLYSTPQVYIDDLIVNTDIQGLTGIIVYNVTHKGSTSDEVRCSVQVFDGPFQVTGYNECTGLLEIGNANLWWPYLMHPDPGYLYTIKASLIGPQGEVIDTYNQTIGIRSVTWSNTTIYLNNKPLYLKGVGMHEDSDLRGKGWDPVLWVKNFNLIKWLGANAFRTSHYPYAEEIYQLADKYGIMIIDECPSVDTDGFSDTLLAKHKQSLTELIRRDKNHPSVIMWSISNEPRSSNELADRYFEEVVRHVKSMDISRPVTIAVSVGATADKSGRHVDVIGFNRYNGWYANPGKTAQITNNVVEEATNWHRIHNKPIIMFEYGAGTMEGLHLYPEYIWSEEYQCVLIAEHFKAFDQLRKAEFFAGEFIWNFADFKTSQSITRVGANKKGIFTRNRQPKAAAHLLRSRYHALATSYYGAPLLFDGTYYISDKQPAKLEELTAGSL